LESDVDLFLLCEGERPYCKQDSLSFSRLSDPRVTRVSLCGSRGVVLNGAVTEDLCEAFNGGSMTHGDFDMKYIAGDDAAGTGRWCISNDRYAAFTVDDTGSPSEG